MFSLHIKHHINPFEESKEMESAVTARQQAAFQFRHLSHVTAEMIGEWLV